MQSLEIMITKEQNKFIINYFVHKDIIVPKYFCFNGHSVPRILRPFLGQFDYIQASLVHDFLYNEASDNYNISRKEADVVYLNMLKELGCNKLISNCSYLAVRLFGRKYYKISE